MRAAAVIYLPLDELQRFGVKAADVLNARYVDGFVPLMRFQAERARDVYREALALLPAEDRKAQRTGLIMGAIYATLLDEIERANFQRAAPAHRTDAAAQALDRVEDLGLRVTRPLRVAVIGAGWAGCAAAAECARAGHRVHLLEASSELGGRARRVVLDLDGQRHTLDNGQHLLIGAYTAIGQLLGADRRGAG